MKTLNQTFYSSEISLGLKLVFCGREKCKANHRYGPSKRPHYLFHYILSGSGKFISKNKTFELSTGQGFLITPGEVTTYMADQDDPWSYVWLCFDGPDAEKILKTCLLSRSQPIYNGGHHDEICNLLNELIDYATHVEQFSYKALSLAYEFFDLLKVEDKKKLTHEVYVNRAIEFIRSNYSYDIQIADVAKAVGLDRTYLFRLFKKELGVSIQEYLINYRLMMVRDLLAYEKLNITEIVYSCGFSDYSLFYRHFLKAFDMTPKAFRTSLLSQ